MNTIVCGRGWLNKASDARERILVVPQMNADERGFKICAHPRPSAVKALLEVQLQAELELP